MIEILETMVATLWLMLPIYLPNPMAVVFKGSFPMDFGKNFYDGRRILGRGKTWRGFFGGSVSGFLLGLFQNFISRYLPQPWFPEFSQDYIYASLLLLTMAFGSMTGDSFGSFIKRRIGIESGGKAFLLDQLMFVVISWILIYLLFPSWFITHFWNIVSIITVFVITPVIHRAVNIAGYKMGLKEVPW